MFFVNGFLGVDMDALRVVLYVYAQFPEDSSPIMRRKLLKE